MPRMRCAILALTLGLLAGGPAAAGVVQPVPDRQASENKMPAYPKEARRLEQEGKVVLRVLVGASGKALAVQTAAAILCSTRRRWTPCGRGALSPARATACRTACGRACPSPSC